MEKEMPPPICCFISIRLLSNTVGIVRFKKKNFILFFSSLSSPLSYPVTDGLSPIGSLITDLSLPF